MTRVEQLRGLCRVLLVTKDDEGFLMRVLPRFRKVVEQLDQKSRLAAKSKGKLAPGEVMRGSDQEIRQL